jgi:DNA-binding CsgD family transcriptional regulator
MFGSPLNKTLPAGLVDSGVEFFAFRNEVMCLHNGRTFYFEEIPSFILEIVEQDMMAHPEALRSLADWNIHRHEDMLRQYIYCRFGGFDNDPDIDSTGKIDHTEYFDCGQRGVCRFEGKLCCTIKAENGNLTKQELEVLKRVQLPDKQIADELNISVETVSSHWQNIRNKTGRRSKIELAVFASTKRLIEIQ